MAKREMPEVGRFERGRTDMYSGESWIYVTREMAHAHPKGQLNIMLYLIILYMAVLGAGKVGVFFSPQVAGLNFWWIAFGLAGGILNLLTAIGLYFKVPWSVVLAVVQVIFPIVGFARSLSSGVPIFMLVETAFLIVTLLYLIDGERPNLIYRYRYRASDAGEDTSGDDAP